MIPLTNYYAVHRIKMLYKSLHWGQNCVTMNIIAEFQESAYISISVYLGSFSFFSGSCFDTNFLGTYP